MHRPFEVSVLQPLQFKAYHWAIRLISNQSNAMKKKVILLEFNELTPWLLDKWMKSGDLPNFKRLHDQSVAYTTESDEKDPAYMEPWIQWYSMHTGMPFSEHKVFHLTDGPRASHEDIWGFFRASGKKVWNCSSMNAKAFSQSGSAFLPDPWCTTERASPESLNIFHKFVSNQVREYSNDNPLKIKDVIDFVAFMITHGLSLKTISTISRQLITEIGKGREESWKRVIILDRLLFDVFRYFYKKEQPDFSSFFVNSVAHLQHSYWRHMDPESFTIKPEKEEMDRFGDAILFGYKALDHLVGEFMALAGQDARIILATALSQQPYLKYEHIGGHHFYRPKSIEQLLAAAGIQYETVQPVMTHQFLLTLKDANATQIAHERLASLYIDGQQVFGFDQSEPNSIYFGCQIRTQIPKDAALNSSHASWNSVNFFDHFYKIEGLKSGRHHPDGCLWIQSQSPEIKQDKVSILDVFPTVASMLQLAPKNKHGVVLDY